LAAIPVSASLCLRGRAGTVDERLCENGEEESTSLSGTSLGTSHEITTAHDDGNGVLLYGCGNLVSGEFDVAQEMVVERGVREACDGLWHALAGSLDGNIIVFLEVDTGLLLGGVVGDTEELALNAGVGWAWDVLAVLPLTITRATSASTTATARLAVC
jgi:hypothetical protein